MTGAGPRAELLSPRTPHPVQDGGVRVRNLNVRFEVAGGPRGSPSTLPGNHASMMGEGIANRWTPGPGSAGYR